MTTEQMRAGDGNRPRDRPILQIGDVAPDFRARTTMGDFRLRDYQGRWVLLFSHPADFTPVCTSEFVAFAKAKDRFAALDCALVAVSVDSLFSHLAWIKAIHDAFDIAVEFPIVEDPSLVIGRAYGMVADHALDAATMRSTFVIDPNGIIRAILTYPATIGRSVDELIRVIAALQKVDRDDVVTPEGWVPGADVLLPPVSDASHILSQKNDPLWFYQRRGDKI